MPIILKGVQTAEDALIAARAGVRGIVVSNHGGRQLDSARSGIEVLAEVMIALREVRLVRFNFIHRFRSPPPSS
jgi:L-lactate dehydrogenase (cytochrome)